MSVYKPEEEVIDPNSEARFENGAEVGELARGILGDYVDVTIRKTDDRLDLAAMISKTKELMDAGQEIICEASFSNDGNYCAVDILHKTKDGWAIYEVKSTSFPEFNGNPAKLDKYLPDVAYQKWVLEKCGVNVTGTFLVCLNSDYVREGELDLQKLFVINDMGEMIANEYDKVENIQREVKKLLQQEEEPAMDIWEGCKKPYDCAFYQYCSRHLPSPSVFDLYRMRFSDKLKYYRQGLVTYDDIKNEKLTPVRRIQVDSVLANTPHIEADKIKEFLGTLTYPLYFLDFETMQQAIPEYDGMKVYQQVTFQYSLHIIEKEGGELIHKEHLGISGTDPRRALAEQLCQDIPMDVCTLAYNKAFECTRIKELAEWYPDLAEHLLNIQEHIIDLMIPFQQGAYYLPSMGGSFSIKVVLPTLFPNDPALDYHNLEGCVHNGGEAMTIFPKIQFMEPEKQQSVRTALLKYCCLDTFAMVKIWEKLKDCCG
jgi:hypothetical protein